MAFDSQILTKLLFFKFKLYRKLLSLIKYYVDCIYLFVVRTIVMGIILIDYQSIIGFNF